MQMSPAFANGPRCGQGTEMCQWGSPPDRQPRPARDRHECANYTGAGSKGSRICVVYLLFAATVFILFLSMVSYPHRGHEGDKGSRL